MDHLEKLCFIMYYYYYACYNHYNSKIKGEGQDFPAGKSSPPGGELKPAWKCCPPTPPGVKIIRVGGGHDIPGNFAPKEASCPEGGRGGGGKINCYTGTPPRDPQIGVTECVIIRNKNIYGLGVRI